MNTINNRDAKYLMVVCSHDENYFHQFKENVAISGLEMILARDEQQASTLIENQFPNLVLIDENFGEVDGFAYMQSVQSKLSTEDTAVVLLIGSANREAMQRVSESGAADFVLKANFWAVLEYRLANVLQHGEARKFSQRQSRVSQFDQLTGLLNRQHFHRVFERSLLKAKSVQRPGAVIVIDIDNFKRINSMFDYQGGDHILNVIGKRLSAGLRNGDLLTREVEVAPEGQNVARLGGDEFTMYIDGVGSKENVVAIVKRCLERITAPILMAGQEVVLTPSIGISLFAQDGNDVNTLLKNAERAMYAAKAQGGGGYQFYKDEMGLNANTHFMLESDLRMALERDQLLLHYQPQVDSTTGLVDSVEVLCRWRHPELGMVPPDQFIPLAENSGLIVPMGDWVLQTACAQARKWLDQGIALNRIAVNVSAFQFYRADFIDKIKQTLRKANLSPKHLELELTESIIMSDADENIGKLNRLKRLGIKLAVDDFGTGYSSLSYLKKLPLDTLKIDRSFVANLVCESTDNAIVSAILTLADKLELNVVAEGVEEFAQLEFLREHKCNLVQGFYFSPAKAAEEITEFLGKTFACEPQGMILPASAENQKRRRVLAS